MDKDVADFVLVLLHSGTNAHLMHLAAEGPGSYAKHQALGEYYKEIIETTDQFAEAYQGKYGRIKGYGEDYHVSVLTRSLTRVVLLAFAIRIRVPNTSRSKRIPETLDSLRDSDHAMKEH